MFALDVTNPRFLAILAITAIASVVATLLISRRSRRKLEERLIREWGRPRDRWRDMDAIASYFRVSASRALDLAPLDDRTWEDLNLDAVFAWADHTESTVGQQLLYQRLRNQSSPPDLLVETMAESVTVDATLRMRVRLALSQLRSGDGWQLWRLTEPDFLVARAWHVVFPLLTLVSVASLCVAPFWPRSLLVLFGVLVTNLWMRAKLSTTIDATVSPFRQLDPLLSAARNLAPVSGPGFDVVSDTFRQGLPKLQRLGSIAAWVGRGSGGNEIIASIQEYLNLFFLVDANAVFFGARLLRDQRHNLAEVLGAVGKVDVAVSIASLRASQTVWCRPTFIDNAAQTELIDIRHPLVPDAVPNTLLMNALRGVVITGSNMSGKSTFLRTAGINAVLASTLNTCLATTYNAPMYRVRSCIGREDDLLAGKSYYLVEVDSVLERVRESEGVTPHLFLFDELFRGTNTVERISAGESVLRELLAGGAQHLIIAATHDIELVTLLADCCTPMHFDERVTPEGLTFDFALKPGPATTRNAIALLRLHGAPAALTERASARALQLDAERALRRARQPDT